MNMTIPSIHSLSNSRSMCFKAQDGADNIKKLNSTKRGTMKFD